MSTRRNKTDGVETRGDASISPQGEGRGRRRMPRIVSVDIREPTDEERREYNVAVRSALASIIDLLDREKESPT